MRPEREVRINKVRQPRVNRCGECGTEVSKSELLCQECRKPTVEDEGEEARRTR